MQYNKDEDEDEDPADEDDDGGSDEDSDEDYGGGRASRRGNGTVAGDSKRRKSRDLSSGGKQSQQVS